MWVCGSKLRLSPNESAKSTTFGVLACHQRPLAHHVPLPKPNTPFNTTQPNSIQPPSPKPNRTPFYTLCPPKTTTNQQTTKKHQKTTPNTTTKQRSVTWAFFVPAQPRGPVATAVGLEAQSEVLHRTRSPETPIGHGASEDGILKATWSLGESLRVGLLVVWFVFARFFQPGKSSEIVKCFSSFCFFIQMSGQRFVWFCFCLKNRAIDKNILKCMCCCWFGGLGLPQPGVFGFLRSGWLCGILDVLIGAPFVYEGSSESTRLYAGKGKWNKKTKKLLITILHMSIWTLWLYVFFFSWMKEGKTTDKCLEHPNTIGNFLVSLPFGYGSRQGTSKNTHIRKKTKKTQSLWSPRLGAPIW